MLRQDSWLHVLLALNLRSSQIGLKGRLSPGRLDLFVEEFERINRMLTEVNQDILQIPSGHFCSQIFIVLIALENFGIVGIVPASQGLPIGIIPQAHGDISDFGGPDTYLATNQLLIVGRQTLV